MNRGPERMKRGIRGPIVEERFRVPTIGDMCYRQLNWWHQTQHKRNRRKEAMRFVSTNDELRVKFYRHKRGDVLHVALSTKYSTERQEREKVKEV